MRGAVLSNGGKAILALRSTASNDTVSRIVPTLKPRFRNNPGPRRHPLCRHRSTALPIFMARTCASGHWRLSLLRITEIQTLARWMRPKKNGLIYSDQAFIPGDKGIYPSELETFRKSKSGLEFLVRPLKITDESLYREFLHNLSDLSLLPEIHFQKTGYASRADSAVDRHRLLQRNGGRSRDWRRNTGDNHRDRPLLYQTRSDRSPRLPSLVRDDYQGAGIGTELLSYLTYLAKRAGLRGFTR